ncbi:FliM/FliN family flagellar motor switch protein [Lentibacter sp.]|uniref:FliM/FliN family flagellar motor switch protein n=1 Tax=Lentibacter sp. TaxID=2024994 RepID=UPI003F698858
MGETSEHDVLRRKAQAGREEQRARVMTPARAMRIALLRSAETLFELALSVSDVQDEQLGQEALLRNMDADMLYILLDGPKGALGVVGIDLPLVNGFVEKQTIGRVSERASSNRAATATDAALIAPYITQVLSAMSEDLKGTSAALTEGFGFGARIESKRHLGLMLEAADYRVLRADLELESGVKRGGIVLCLPVLRPEPLVSAAARTGSSEAYDEAEGRRLRDGALMEARAVVRAVIHRRRMTLGELSALSVGDHLHFGAGALARVELDVGGGGASLGPCKLGKQDGMRALKLQFGARTVVKGPFEPMGQEDVWLKEDELEQPYASAEAGATMQPITVDDLPDLSDLAGFETGFEAPDSPAPFTELPEDLSQVG